MTDHTRPRGYVGRFAPSPTGPLHFGSLVAAVGSYLQARRHNGHWWLRMEDVDTTRCDPESADRILFALEAFGFEWDGEVLYQSRRDEVYEAVLQDLRAMNRVYPCGCSRKAIEQRIDAERLPAAIYPGTCRQSSPRPSGHYAWRLRVDPVEIGFFDPIQGDTRQQLASEVGDFVLRRADGLYAYQLAVVVDDHLQGITEVVRGSDLLDNTPRQIFLQGLLGYASPGYVHLPVAANPQGQKLSKQNLAPPLDPKHPSPALWRALAFLGQDPPTELQAAAPSELWDWAMENWSLERVPRVRGRAVPPDTVA